MKNTLWIGLGNSAQAWYRCAMPANHLDQDWVGAAHGVPNEGGVILTGNLQTSIIDYDKYENIIIQLGSDSSFIPKIKQWQKEGKRIFYECDDFLHGIYNIKDHRFKSEFAKKRVKKYVEVMQACDSLICSTDFLADQYKKYNSDVYVCKNGIDTQLYENQKPESQGETVFFGWSGGTGHLQAMKSWFNAVLLVMDYKKNSYFLTCGANYADQANEIFPNRATSIPWTTIENYPFVINSFDIAIAPSHDSKYFKSKSDLRWLEASASGVPVIASPLTYKEIKEGETGFLASTPEEFENKLVKLIEDKDLRIKVGEQARQYIKDNKDISIMKNQWSEIL